MATFPSKHKGDSSVLVFFVELCFGVSSRHRKSNSCFLSDRDVNLEPTATS